MSKVHKGALRLFLARLLVRLCLLLAICTQASLSNAKDANRSIAAQSGIQQQATQPQHAPQAPRAPQAPQKAPQAPQAPQKAQPTPGTAAPNTRPQNAPPPAAAQPQPPNSQIKPPPVVPPNPAPQPVKPLVMPPAVPTHVPPPAVRSPFIHGHYVIGKTIPVNGYHSGSPVVVIVDKKDHKTNVLQLQNNRVVRILTVTNAVGKSSTPSPPGRYLVSKKEMYPVWNPPKDIDPKRKKVKPYNVDHKNPLGVARITLNKFQIALHGTNSPRKLSKNVSHGCVRHSNKDIMKLYGLVNRGTVVYIVNNWQGKVLNQADFEPKKSKAKKAHA